MSLYLKEEVQVNAGKINNGIILIIPMKEYLLDATSDVIRYLERNNFCVTTITHIIWWYYYIPILCIKVRKIIVYNRIFTQMEELCQSGRIFQPLLAHCASSWSNILNVKLLIEILLADLDMDFVMHKFGICVKPLW